MSDPIVPNFKPGVGRLVADRFDFEKHINGSDFKHNATTIDLSPAISISSTDQSNVYDAIAALAAIVTPPSIDDATTTTKGIVKLAGDIGGTATSVTVKKIQGRNVANIAPSDTQVLTWNTARSYWEPANAPNGFAAGGDLTGTALNQKVLNITGDGVGGTVNIIASEMLFSNGVIPTLKQANISSAPGSPFLIVAQTSTSAGGDGGDIIISGGTPGSGGLKGGVKLSMDTNSAIMLQAAEVISGQRVVSLCNPFGLTNVDMPADTGDMVIYIRDASADPSSGNPASGVILYSSSGELHVKQPNGNDFSVGSIPNPSLWGEHVYSRRDTAQSTTSARVLGTSYTLADSAGTRIDVIAIGKQVGSNNSAQYNLSMGYTRNSSGAAVAVGSVTVSDTRFTAGASAWTAPTISLSSNNAEIYSGYNAATVINWLFITQITMCDG